MAKGANKLNMKIGERLQSARENLGYTQEMFAEALNVEVVHYQRLERGEYALTLDKMVVLHEKYGIDLNYLIAGKMAGNSSQDFDLNAYIANCSWEGRNELLAELFRYLWKLASHYKP